MKRQLTSKCNNMELSRRGALPLTHFLCVSACGSSQDSVRCLLPIPRESKGMLSWCTLRRRVRERGRTTSLQQPCGGFWAICSLELAQSTKALLRSPDPHAPCNATFPGWQRQSSRLGSSPIPVCLRQPWSLPVAPAPLTKLLPHIPHVLFERWPAYG